MIAKRIFFLWFGEKTCPYKDICINSYRSFHEDFELNYIEEKDIFNSHNDDIKDCLKLMQTEGNFFYEVANRPHRKDLLSKYGCFNTNFSFIFRMYLYNKYGGIYVDLDTFCFRRFDERVLNNKLFFSNNSTFFQGGEQGCIDLNWKSKNFDYIRAKKPFLAVDNCINESFNKGNEEKAIQEIITMVADKGYIRDLYLKPENYKYICHFRKHEWKMESSG